MELVALNQLDLDVLPEGSEPDSCEELTSEEPTSEDDELDITKPRQFGRQSTRDRTQTKLFGKQKGLLGL